MLSRWSVRGAWPPSQARCQVAGFSSWAVPGVHFWWSCCGRVHLVEVSLMLWEPGTASAFWKSFGPLLCNAVQWQKIVCKSEILAAFGSLSLLTERPIGSLARRVLSQHVERNNTAAWANWLGAHQALFDFPLLSQVCEGPTIKEYRMAIGIISNIQLPGLFSTVWLQTYSSW